MQDKCHEYEPYGWLSWITLACKLNWSADSHKVHKVMMFESDESVISQTKPGLRHLSPHWMEQQRFTSQ